MKQITGDEMEKIVKAGYSLGEYAKYFGRNYNLSSFEKSFFDILIQRFSGKSGILDLGCGTGLPFDSYLTDNGHDVTGIDVAENHIKSAMNNIKKETIS